jgi:hypothetical protein
VRQEGGWASGRSRQLPRCRHRAVERAAVGVRAGAVIGAQCCWCGTGRGLAGASGVNGEGGVRWAGAVSHGALLPLLKVSQVACQVGSGSWVPYAASKSSDTECTRASPSCIAYSCAQAAPTRMHGTRQPRIHALGKQASLHHMHAPHTPHTTHTSGTYSSSTPVRPEPGSCRLPAPPPHPHPPPPSCQTPRPSTRLP